MKGFNSDVVIGLEIHVELNTETKLFCSCRRHGSDEPNSRTCPICLGHPGSKPVLNKRVIEHALKLAIAARSRIAKELVFSRKSYFYPDMAKNYQISQFELPLAEGGHIELLSGKKINLTRIHMEEDPAALIHPGGMGNGYVLVDYNRSGDPLVEIVTEPEIESAEEARDFMKCLITILNYLRIFDVKSCIIKADANVSIKESGYVRAEVKNITGFKEIERAIKYEIMRQKKEFSEGKRFVQETRGWNSEKGVTISLRTKETEEDYGYIIDPDLVATDLTADWISRLEKEMPELAHDKAKRYVASYKLDETDARVIANTYELAMMFEKLVTKIDPVLAARWLRRELTRVMNYNKIEFEDLKITEKHLHDLLKLISEKRITDNVGQKILEKLAAEPFDVLEHVRKEKLEAVSGKGELEKFCKEAIAEAQKAAEDYRKGSEKSLNFIVGIVMKKTRGTATPQEVREIIIRLIG